MRRREISKWLLLDGEMAPILLSCHPPHRLLYLSLLSYKADLEF